jgi:hypothetical protein
MLPLYVILLSRVTNHLKVRMSGQYLIVDAANPMPARAHFSVGHCSQVLT